MTPEREAQMREMFQKRYGKRPTNDPLLEATWDDRKRVWDYCLNSLEPMVMDGRRWRTFERALRTGRLPGAAYGRRFKIIETCPMSGDKKEFNAFVEAIDAAMSAALEDGNATE